MSEILQHLDSIQELPSGGYLMPPDAEAVVARYLQSYGFELAQLETYRELLETMRFCNAQDFARAVERPAPTPGLRFLWKRLHGLE